MFSNSKIVTAVFTFCAVYKHTYTHIHTYTYTHTHIRVQSYSYYNRMIEHVPVYVYTTISKKVVVVNG